MWPFKKKGDTGADEPTLKRNVTAFWEWFAGNAERFYDTIENKKCSDLTDEMVEAVDRWLPGMAWVFGPGKNRVGHSLTISGEGVRTQQMVAQYCVGRAPPLPNWTFYGSRQPRLDVEASQIRIGGDSFKTEELWIAPFVDDQNEVIDIEAWHPLFAKMDANQRGMVLFLLLDEVLGEIGTCRWIGEIKFGEGRLKDAIPIWELRDLVAKLQADKGWQKDRLGVVWEREPGGGHPRGDIYIGSTSNFPLVTAYDAARGPIEHPLPGLGVDLAFVRFSSACLPKGEEVSFRGQIDDALSEVLVADHSGETFGGATGLDWAYIDLMLYDGQRSLEKVIKVLRELKLPKDTHIRWFTSDKADKVVRM
jgi:hypothetical protein